MSLPLVIAPGDPGHIGDHEEIDELLSRMDGQTAFLATGAAIGLLVDRPTAGPGNEGLFYFASDVPALSFSDGSQWRYQSQGYLPVLVAAPDGTDITTLLQDAIDSAAAGNTREVVVSATATEFFVSSDVSIPSYITVRSAGRCVLKIPDGVTARIFQSVDTDDVTVQGFDFDLNKANTPDGGNEADQMAIYFFADTIGVRRAKVLDCNFRDGHWMALRGGATDQGAGTPLPCEVKVEGGSVSGFTNTVSPAFYFIRTTRAVARDVTFSGNWTDAEWWGGSNGLADACTSDDATGSSIVFNQSHVGGHATDNTVRTSGSWAILFSVKCIDFVARGNTVLGSWGGIAADLKAPGDATIQPGNGVIANNTVGGCTNQHAYHTNYAAGVEFADNVGYGCVNGNGVHLDTSSGCGVHGGSYFSNSDYAVRCDDGLAGAGGVGFHDIGPFNHFGNVAGVFFEAPTLHGTLARLKGSGSPEGAITASPGSTWERVDNGTHYIKNTGQATTTGWKLVTAA